MVRKIAFLLLIVNLIYAQDILFPGKTDANDINSEKIDTDIGNDTNHKVLIKEIFNEDFGEPVVTRYCNL